MPYSNNACNDIKDIFTTRRKKEGHFGSIMTARLDRSRESACGLYDMLGNAFVRRAYLTNFWMLGMKICFWIDAGLQVLGIDVGWI